MLKRGSTGNEVGIVQFALNGVSSFTPKLKTDGIFGPKTDARVRQHQSQQKLAPDGIVGPLTLGSLFEGVMLSGTTKVTHIGDGPARVGAVRSLAPPKLGPSLSPELQAFGRAQAAFLQWMAHPIPKPSLPTPGLLVVPTPGPFGPVVLPRETVFQTPPAPVKTAQIQFTREPEEGGNVTVHFDSETTHSSIKRIPKETVFKFSIEWLMLKGRLAELALEPAVVKKKAADGWSVEVEFSVTGGSGLSLKLQAGPLGLSLAPHLAAAVSSELSAQFFAGGKGEAEITLIQSPDGKRAFKVILATKAGFKGEYGPERFPDGREVTHWLTPSFIGSTSVGIAITFP